MALNPINDLVAWRSTQQSMDWVIGHAVMELVDAGKPVTVEAISTRLGELAMEEYAQLFALRVRGAATPPTGGRNTPGRGYPRRR